MIDLTLVAALAKNRVIGRAGHMPWHLPADLKHFKALTLGHPVIMGRKTFTAIGHALPGRLNIVISRSQPPLPDGVVSAGSLDEAIRACPAQGRAMIIGGGEIYRLALPQAHCLELTLIDAAPEGDTWFPSFLLDDWHLKRMTARPADAKNPYRLSFCRFERG